MARTQAATPEASGKPPMSPEERAHREELLKELCRPVAWYLKKYGYDRLAIRREGDEFFVDCTVDP